MKKKLLAILMVLSLILPMTACTQASTQKSSESSDLSATSSEISNDTSVSSGVVVNDISTKPEGEALDGPDTRPYGTESGLNATYGTPVYYYEETGETFDPIEMVIWSTDREVHDTTMAGTGDISAAMRTLCIPDSVVWTVIPTSNAYIQFDVTVEGVYTSDIDNTLNGQSLVVTYQVSTDNGGETFSQVLLDATIGDIDIPKDEEGYLTPMWLIERADASTKFTIMYYDFTVPDQVLANQVQYYAEFDHDKYLELCDTYSDWAANMSQVGSDPA